MIRMMLNEKHITLIKHEIMDTSLKANSLNSACIYLIYLFLGSTLDCLRSPPPHPPVSENSNIPTSFLVALDIYLIPALGPYPCLCDASHNLPDTCRTANNDR